jgi:hypothetical protein
MQASYNDGMQVNPTAAKVQCEILNNLGEFVRLHGDGNTWDKARMMFWRYIFDTKQCKVDWYTFKRLFDSIVPENLEG